MIRFCHTEDVTYLFDEKKKSYIIMKECVAYVLCKLNQKRKKVGQHIFSLV